MHRISVPAGLLLVYYSLQSMILLGGMVEAKGSVICEI
jgi:hypothetical protein